MSPKILIIPYVAVLVFLASITWIALPNYEDMAQLLSLARKGLAASQPYDHTAEIERMAEAICKEFREQPDGAQVWVENGGIRQETLAHVNN
jgi:deoxyribodipyrimidine photolyase-like uncharacterized protein